jgi:hypothetical protein
LMAFSITQRNERSSSAIQISDVVCMLCLYR